MRLAVPVLIMAVVIIGCEAPENIGPIDSIMVISKQRTESFDGDQTPDGLWASVFLYRNSQTKPVSVTNVKGTLDLMLYNGNGRHANLERVKPLHVWTYLPPELKKAEGKMLGQKCFILQLPWGKDVPSQKIITVRAKYTSEKQQTIFSKLQLLPSGVGK